MGIDRFIPHRFARVYPTYGPNTLLLDNSLATMGAGLSSAMAVAFKWPKKKVMAVCGDGGFAMNSQELATCVEHKLDLTCLVLNDNAYGMIEWKQHNAGLPKWGLGRFHCDERLSPSVPSFPFYLPLSVPSTPCSVNFFQLLLSVYFLSLGLLNPDFAALAESYGAIGHRVNSSEELESTLRKCLSTKGTHVVDIPINYDLSNELLGPILAKEIAALRKEGPEVK